MISLLLLAVLLLEPPPLATALDNGVAQTPPMGLKCDTAYALVSIASVH